MLTDAGADLGAHLADGARPLHMAAHGGCSERYGRCWSWGRTFTPWTNLDALHCMTRAARRQCSRCWRQRLTSTAAAPLALRLCFDQPATAVTAMVQAGACPDASDAVWRVDLIVRAVEGDEEAVTALVAARGS